MPVYLDQALRKTLLSKVRDAFAQDEHLAGKVRVLDQETFLPEVEHQVILTDLSLANGNLDASNRVTTLSGRVTFAPLGPLTHTFLFWAQENPRQTQLVDHGFYQLTLNKAPLGEVSPTSPDASWMLSVEVLKRVTQTRRPWGGLKLYFDKFLNSLGSSFDPELLVVKRGPICLYRGLDYHLREPEILLRRFSRDMRIEYNSIDITDQCTFLDLINSEITLQNITQPLKLGDGCVPETVSVYNVSLNRPQADGWFLKDGSLHWAGRTARGTQILVQYYQKKSLLFWDLPTEFQIPLENTPLIFSNGESSLKVVSSVRGVLPTDKYEVVDQVIRLIEPYPAESISIDYRYHVKSITSKSVLPNTYDDQIIPGLVLTFTDNFSDGAQAVIIRHDQPKAIGQENGGNNKVEITFRLRSSDDSTLARMSSRAFFLFTDEQSLFDLTSQGITLEPGVAYARTFEERDNNSDKWIVNTFRISLHHSWRYLIPFITDLNSTEITTGLIQDNGDLLPPTFEEIEAYTYTNPASAPRLRLPYGRIGAPTKMEQIIKSSPSDWVQNY